MKTRSSLDLVVLLALAVASTIGLHQLGGVPGLNVEWSDPVGWVETAPAEDVIGALLRHVGLVIGYWVLATTAVYMATGLRGRRPRWVRLITVPVVRRAVDRALAAGLAVTIITAPAGPVLATESPAPIVYEASSDGIPVPHVQHGDSSATSEPIAPRPATEQIPSSVPIPIMVPLATANNEPAADNQHAVVAGENLWAIAEAHLTKTLERTPELAEVTRYWRQVIEANLGTIRSGDPNLIYPGEVVTLPATP
jgi:hypothetical protein